MAAHRIYVVQTGFSEARSIFTSEYDNPSIAFSATHSLFSRQTVYELFSEDRPDSSFSPGVQERLTGFIEKSAEYEYQNLAQKIEQTSADVQLIEQHLGTYQYWRFNIQGNLVNGSIHVFRQGEMYRFFHFNDPVRVSCFGKEDSLVPDHEGYVFALRNRIHLHGMGSEYIRPAIANVVNSVVTEYVDGLVLTVQRGSMALMAASFVMIHEQHEHFLNTEKNEEFTTALSERILRNNQVGGVLTTTLE